MLFVVVDQSTSVYKDNLDDLGIIGVFDDYELALEVAGERARKAFLRYKGCSLDVVRVGELQQRFVIADGDMQLQSFVVLKVREE